VVCLLFSACHQINHGIVVEKKLVPAETIWLLEPMSFDGGKTQTFIPRPLFFPESYILYVSGRDKHGKLRTEEFYVEQSEFSQLAIGDTYTCGEIKQCVTDRPKQ
jgi:hypothetical protein